MCYFREAGLVYLFIVFHCWTYANEYRAIGEKQKMGPKLFDAIPYPPAGVIPLLNKKIFRGRRVTIREQPYVASIRRNVAHYLVGTILTKNIVLTVAYPLVNVSIAELSVVAGENYADRGSVLQTVILVILHEHFNMHSLENDIAMLRIYEDLTYKGSAKTISLRNSTRVEGRQAFVSGWGRCDRTGRELCLPRSTRYTEGEKYDPMLRTVTFNLRQKEPSCNIYTLHGLRIGPGMLCLGKPRLQDKMAPCLAVPGAPLVVHGHLTAMMSWGFGCGHSSDLPLIYTDCQYYMDWIQHNIMILYNIHKVHFFNLFRAKRAFVLTEWFQLTRKLNHTFKDIDRHIEALKIDNYLARLSGTVYDARDYLFNGIHHDYKLNMYKDMRKMASDDIKINNYIDSAQEMLKRRNEDMRPFLDKVYIYENNSDIDSTTSFNEASKTQDGDAVYFEVD